MIRSYSDQTSKNEDIPVQSEINTCLNRIWGEYSGNLGGFSYSLGAAAEHYGYVTNAQGKTVSTSVRLSG